MATLRAALAMLTALSLACACSTTPSSPDGGVDVGVDAQPRDLDGASLAQRATDATKPLLKTMSIPTHEGAVTFVDEHRFGKVSQAQPEGLRVQRFKLDNGLAVLLLEDRSAPVFAYQTWFSVGSRHERPGITGIAHLFEHLMFKETSNLAEGEFDRLMEARGAQTNAATWVDWTMYREELPAGHLPLVVKLEADRMENMVLNEAQLESERDVVQNERRFRVDNDPEGTMFEVLYATAFTQHPYRWPTIGWMKDIEAISLQDCLDFYARYYAPNNATVIVVGDFDSAEALALINARYGHLKPSEVTPRTPQAEPRQVRERRRTLVMPLSSPKLLFGYRIPGLADEDHAAMQVLHKVLFGGQSGRLYRRLVVQTELASDASGWVSEFSFPGLYEILITLKTGGDPERVEAVVNEEMARLAREPVSEQELERAKNQLETQFYRNMIEVGDRAYGLGHYAITGGDYKLLFEATERARAVTAEQLRAAAERHMRQSNRTIVTAMPKPAAVKGGQR